MTTYKYSYSESDKHNNNNLLYTQLDNIYRAMHAMREEYAVSCWVSRIHNRNKREHNDIMQKRTVVFPCLAAGDPGIEVVYQKLSCLQMVLTVADVQPPHGLQVSLKELV